MPVILNSHGRDNIFICESVWEEKVYVGSDQGIVLIINIENKILENVFKLHDGGIRCIKIQNGFCATGSSD